MVRMLMFWNTDILNLNCYMTFKGIPWNINTITIRHHQH